MNKAVYITRKILPINNGGAIHTNSTCNVLSDIFDLHVFSLKGEKEDIHGGIKLPFYYEAYASHIKKDLNYYVQALSFELPINRNLLDAICDYIDFNQVKIVFFEIGMVSYVKKIRKCFPGLLFIYISHNAEFMNIRQMINQNQEKKGNCLLYNPLINRFREFLYCRKEMYSCTISKKILSISDIDTTALVSRYKIDRNRFILNKTYRKYERVKHPGDMKGYNKKLLIVGSMSWVPNVEGIVWFVDNVFSRLIEIDDAYRLFLVGRQPNEEIMGIAKKYPKNVVVTGEVDSVDVYYRDCDICIIPIFSGAGLKVKVLEAIGCAIPTISSSFALNGYYELENEMVVANKPDEFIEGIMRLSSSALEREAYSERLAKYYEEYMDTTTLREELMKIDGMVK